jgi:serine protease Do
MLMDKKLIAGGAAGAVLLGVAAYAASEAPQPRLVAAPKPAAVAGPPTTAAPLSSRSARTPKSFADIFARVSPAVVSIDVDRVERAAARRPAAPFGFGFPFGPFPFGGPRGGADQAPELQIRASGSGFFISRDGYIVTNNHVVENARTITVRLTDGRRLTARLVGRDPGTDLAVVKVDGGPFPFVEFETDARPRVGDWVMAVGNPFNLGGTATVGVVSAEGRDIGEQFVGYLQIDAPINRGNSGGPTFDVYGRVVGVNTAIFTPSGGSVGIGFAIPSDLADRVTRQLISEGKVTRGYLGATIQSVTPDIAASLGKGAPAGALVTEVVPDGPAAKGGLQSGDLIVALDGKAVSSSGDLTRRIAAATPGQRLSIQVERRGERRTVLVTAGERPAEAELAQQGGGGPGAASAGPLGLQLGRLDDAARRRLNLDDDAQGALVTGVESGSAAAREGVRSGDVVVRAGDPPGAGPAAVAEAVSPAKAAGRKSVLLLVSRNGRNTFVALPLPG